MIQREVTVPVEVPGGQLIVRSVGEGAPIMLLPGGAATSHPYYPHLEGALDGFRVLTFDRPGTGTAAHLGRATLPSASTAIATVLNALDATDAVLVGHSLGGAVAIQHAVDNPGRGQGLVLLDPTPINDMLLARVLPRLMPLTALLARAPVLPVGQDATFRRLSKVLGPLDEEAQDCLRSLVYSASVEVTTAAISSFSIDARALTARLTDVGMPVRVISADRKPRNRLRRSHEHLAEALGGQLQIWPGTIHPLHLQQPARVAQVVREVFAA